MTCWLTKHVYADTPNLHIPVSYFLAVQHASQIKAEVQRMEEFDADRLLRPEPSVQLCSMLSNAKHTCTEV